MNIKKSWKIPRGHKNEQNILPKTNDNIVIIIKPKRIAENPEKKILKNEGVNCKFVIYLLKTLKIELETKKIIVMDIKKSKEKISLNAFSLTILIL